jgi:hypothetical protein
MKAEAARVHRHEAWVMVMMAVAELMEAAWMRVVMVRLS